MKRNQVMIGNARLGIEVLEQQKAHAKTDEERDALQAQIENIRESVRVLEEDAGLGIET